MSCGAGIGRQSGCGFASGGAAAQKHSSDSICATAEPGVAEAGPEARSGSLQQSRRLQAIEGSSSEVAGADPGSYSAPRTRCCCQWARSAAGSRPSPIPQYC